MDSTEVLRQWAERSGEYSPDYYAYYGPDETSERILEYVDSLAPQNCSVLELGCSCGRHLAHLHDHGYEDLHGIEINEEAFDVMAEAYPELADDGTFYADAIENAVGAFEDGQFDVVFSAETLQHIHADNGFVFEEIARITDGHLITVENEGSEDGENTEETDAESETNRESDPDVNYVNGDFPLYYRDWNRVFTGLGFEEVDSRAISQDTLRVFRT